MIFSSKKAMSPLIATVLLIAFAVALGAMIMNWSSDAVVEETEDLSSVCKGVSIFTNSNACYSDGKLTFNVKNDGSTRVDAVKIKSSTDVGDMDLNIKGSSLIVGESLDKSIPFMYGGGSIKLEFYPLVERSGEIVECPSGFEQSSLATC